MTERRAAAAGFTLIEMMIAMLLLSVVVAGLVASLLVIGRAQAASARVDVAQAGVRAALDLVTRDVQMASAGARSGTLSQGSGAPAQVQAVVVTDSTTGPDRLDLVLVDPKGFATALTAYDGTQGAITVDNTTNFNVGDTIQLSDFTVGALLQVTGIGAGSLSLATPTNPLPRSYIPGNYVFRSRVVSYYVDTSFFGAQDPVLMIDPDGAGPQPAQPLAEGIEDLQFALGFDFNNDGVISSVGVNPGDDEWVFNVAGETAPASLAQLRSVRVTLVARTTTAVGNATLGTRPAAEDHPGASAPDPYPRRVLHSEITVRNFNL
jgi:prepilin-type N-terminal cleavage/methylation domain-containing protein